MGFPVVGCCPDLVLPPFLVYLVLFLGYLRRAITWAFDAVGLGDLLDVDDQFQADPTTAPGTGAIAAAAPVRPWPRPRSRSLSAALIREALPSSPYEPPPPQDGEEAPNERCDGEEEESCAVCLHGLEPGEQVRRMGGCRHVFHACCIDPWVDLGRRTCPLCRAPLVPDHLRDSLSLLLLPAGTDTWTDDSQSLVDPASYFSGDLYLADDGDYYPTHQDDGGVFDTIDDDDDVDSLGLPPAQHARDTEFLSWPTLQATTAAAAAPSSTVSS